MAEAVINVFEVIEIDLDNREWQRLLRTALRQYFCAFEECTAIIQTSQRVMPRLPLQGVLKRIHVTDHPTDHQPGDQQHGGKERPQQRKNNADTAKITPYTVMQRMNAQNNAIKVIQPFPAHKATTQADPALGIAFDIIGYLRQLAFVKMVNVARGGR